MTFTSIHKVENPKIRKALNTITRSLDVEKNTITLEQAINSNPKLKKLYANIANDPEFIEQEIELNNELIRTLDKEFYIAESEEDRQRISKTILYYSKQTKILNAKLNI